MNSYLSFPTYALGSQLNSVEDAVAQGLTLTGAEELRSAGFRRHHICPETQSAYDLACETMDQLRDQLADVDAIIYSTCLPLNGNAGNEAEFHSTRDVKYLMDFPASRLQSRFGLSKALVIGVNQQACTGMLGSLRLARALLNTEEDLQRIVCITADRFPPGAIYEQAYNLISDGGAACIVSRVPSGFRIVACEGITNGALSDADDDQTVGVYFNYTIQVIERALKSAGLNMADIDWIVPQNTNEKAWRILCSLLKFDHSKVYCPSMPDAGHVISGDNIINLNRLTNDNCLELGQYLLLVMAGYGLNWQCTILQKVRDE